MCFRFETDNGAGGKAGILSGMVATPKRRWFQIHLSSAVVLMFVASGLVWSNVIPSSRLLPYVFVYGWPLIIYVDYANLPRNTIDGFGLMSEFGNREFMWLHCFMNLIVMLLVFFGVCVCSEWLIRRRETSNDRKIVAPKRMRRREARKP